MNLSARISCLILLPPVLAGCQLTSRISEQVDGTWIGRVEETTVYDARGYSYVAGLLKVESGPGVPLRTGELLDPHHPAILAYDDRHLARIVDPATLPVGKRVRVRGKRIALDVWNRREEQPLGDAAVHRVKGINIPGAHEDVIVVYHPMQVLE